MKASLYRALYSGDAAAEAFASACRLIAGDYESKINEMKWRHHGLGMLQAEFTDDIRIHIWHPKLRTIKEADLRAIHDHRFDLFSCVVVGEISNICYDVIPKERVCDYVARYSDDEIGVDADVHEIVHAKAQGGEGPLSRVCYKAVAMVRELAPDANVHRAKSKAYGVMSSVYGIRARSFHTNMVNDLTITIVVRSNFDDAPARVLSRPGETVQSGIVPESVETLALRNWILREARYALLDNLF